MNGYTNCLSCLGTGEDEEGRCLDCELYRSIDSESQLVKMRKHNPDYWLSAGNPDAEKEE